MKELESWWQRHNF